MQQLWSKLLNANGGQSDFNVEIVISLITSNWFTALKTVNVNLIFVLKREKSCDQEALPGVTNAFNRKNVVLLYIILTKNNF